MSSSRGNNREKTCCGSCCTLLFSLGFVVLIYWAIFQPHQIRAAVDYAELSNLSVSNTSSSSPVAVTYHVAVNLSLYNPSKRVNIYYDTLDAQLAFRGGAVLSPAAAAASPTEFYQRRRTAQAVRLEFDGKGVAVAGDAGARLESEVKAAAGAALALELTASVRVRYVFGSIKIRQKPRVWCAVSIPVPPAPGGTGILGSGDRCWVKY